MVLLVALMPGSDPGARLAIALGATLLATVWTAITVVSAQNPARLSSLGFVVADGVVALLIGAASTAAGAQDLFHGGMPMSWVVVAGYAGGLRWALPAGVVLGIEQMLLHVVDGRGPLPTAGSVTFVVLALIAGWAFDAWRTNLDTERRLAASLQLEARQTERLRLANQLHDTVLQTLSAIRGVADEPREVRYLARRQERELRSTIETFRSSYDPSLRVALLETRDAIEDTFPAEIDVVIRNDSPLTAEGEAILTAVGEALRNATLHSGAPDIDLYATLGDHLEIFIRDRGVGFDVETGLKEERGLRHSVVDPVESVGGTVTIDSAPGRGTEVRITLEKP